jgi:hypothetical protein
MKFIFKKPKEVLIQSFFLGKKLYYEGFRPNHAISLWRGGTIIGLGINEFYRMKGIFINHTSITTSTYNDNFEQKEVIIKGLEHVIKVVVPEDNLLIIDDIFDTGETINTLLNILNAKTRKNMPNLVKIATLDCKPEKNLFKPNITYINSYNKDLWVNYPHEISDLYFSKEENYLLEKDKIAYEILNKTSYPIEEMDYSPYHWLTPDEIFYDSLKLGVNIFYSNFQPDFLIALWPGGVLTGIYIHEVYKYLNKLTGQNRKLPDHVAINTTSSHLSYKSNIIGLQYLIDNINYDDKILIIDTLFKSGKDINLVIDKLKSGLKRNLNHKNIRIASLYFDKESNYTWTVKPNFTEPHFYLKETKGDIIFPHSIHKLPDPQKSLKELMPELYEIIW